MDHVVYLDYKAKELLNLQEGRKTMIVRGAMGRKMPYGRVEASDVLYFIENKGDGLIKAKAVVENVFNSEKLVKEDSVNIIEHHQEQHCLDDNLKKRFAGKRYLVLLTIKRFEEFPPFKIDRSGYKNMDDWLPVDDISKVKMM